MASKGTPRLTYPYKTSPKDKKKSYELRLAAQFGDRKAKEKLWAYNRRIKERKMEANKIEWVVEGLKFNRYKMMDFIVSRVSNGEPLDEVCGPEEMPSMLEVYSWMDNHPDFASALKRAEEVRGHRLGEEALRVAMGTDRENVAADKLKFEALSKAAARLNSRYTDKQIIEQRDEYSNMTAEQIRDRISRMLQADPSLLEKAQTLGFGNTPALPGTAEPPPASDALVLDCDEIHTPAEAEIEPTDQDPDRE